MRPWTCGFNLATTLGPRQYQELGAGQAQGHEADGLQEGGTISKGLLENESPHCHFHCRFKEASRLCYVVQFHSE